MVVDSIVRMLGYTLLAIGTSYFVLVVFHLVSIIRKSNQADSPESTARAEWILCHWLGEKAYKDYLSRGAVTIVGQSGTLYDVTGTVIYDLTALRKFCFQPNQICPKADAVLAQVIMLKCNEKEALRVAHWWTW